jgi:amino acid adenylation domain-containing protein
MLELRMTITNAAPTVATDDLRSEPGESPRNGATAGVSRIDELLDRSNLTGRQFLIYAGQRMHPGVVLYNSVYAINWPGLNAGRFKLAWQRLVDSCDALRTVFEEVDGVPQQRVVAPFETDMECVDLGRHQGPEPTLGEWIASRLKRPLVLAECVFDTALVITAERDYVWFLHIHHIVVDGAGVQILLRRLTELYADPAAALGSAPRFAEYAATACALRQSEQYRIDRSYWHASLKNAPETPRYYGVDASRTTVEERIVLSLDVPTSAAISSLARSLATPSMSEHAAAANLFNAVFAAYLSRVGGGERISVGVTFHNRRSEIDRRTIGLFMEVLPLALCVQPHDSLIGLMRQVAECAAEALKHRLYSVGHSARAPAFSALFNYMGPSAPLAERLEVRRFHAGHGSDAISLSIAPRGKTYDLWFDVNADVATSSSAQRLAQHLRTLLSAAVRDPARPLTQLSLLAPLETRDLLAASRGPMLAFPSHGASHAEFEARARSTPDAIALAMGSTRVTYAELNRSANRLAHTLRDLGAERGKRVGICLERSPEMVIAMLAVLKSGAAYVPLDPAYPQTRLGKMLQDADVSVLVTTERIFAELPPHTASPLYIDRETAAAYAAVHNPDISIVAQDIAYVMYTSGSSGAPKGVCVTHGNVSNHLAWRRSYFAVDPSDRFLQTASLSFDDSVWEVLEPLSAGASLVLPRPRFEYDSAYLVRLMIEARITVACFVPSLLRAVLEEADIAHCGSLRRLEIGGEALPVSLQRRALERLPGAACHNGYGTTEATIVSLDWKCADLPGQSTVPIGRPIANTQAYILDPQRQLVPPGVPGEICVGGAGVACGYLNRPELTAERFVDDEFGGVTGAKLYLTGDLGRMRADGVFEFAGRADDQIKIRGVRVELGDIEAAILEHPEVRSTAVVCEEAHSGARLIAYVVPRDSSQLSNAQLRAFVRDRVPAALVPNRFETIAELPLTPSGKLDRRALPAVTGAEEQNNYTAPRTELEIRLVRLWEEVLQVRRIGTGDDFFALGGHSLAAVQIAVTLEKLLARSLSPGLLFEAPTIAMLSSRLSAPIEARGALVQLAQGGPGAPLFLVHHVSGDITAYRDLAPHLGGGRPIYGVRAPELDSNDKPSARVEDMASRYVREIRTIQPHGPYLIGGHSAGAHIAFEMAQQLHSAGEPIALLAILEADARTRRGRRTWLDLARLQVDSLRSLPARQRLAYLRRSFAKLTGRLGRAVGASPAAKAGDGEAMNAVWAAVESAVREYSPQSYPGSVILFRATDRRVTGTYSRTLGWEQLALGGIRVIDVPGTHSTVLKPGSEPPMAPKLRACLDELTAHS